MPGLHCPSDRFFAEGAFASALVSGEMREQAIYQAELKVFGKPQTEGVKSCHNRFEMRC